MPLYSNTAPAGGVALGTGALGAGVGALEDEPQAEIAQVIAAATSDARHGRISARPCG